MVMRCRKTEKRFKVYIAENKIKTNLEGCLK